MDPIGILGLTLSILTAADSVVKLVGHARRPPVDLQQASNDVNDFRIVILSIKDSVTEEQKLLQTLEAQNTQQAGSAESIQTSSTLQQAPRLLQRSEKLLGELEEVIQRSIASQNVKGLKGFSRKKLQDRRRLKALRDQLNSLKTTLATDFAVKGSTSALRSVGLITTLSRDNTRDSQQSNAQIGLLYDIVQQLQPTNNHRVTSTQLPAFLEDPAVIIPPGSTHSESQATLKPPNRDPAGVSASADVEDDGAVFKLDITPEISHFRKSTCRPFCSCACHKRHRRRPNNAINSLLGSIFLGYSHVPFMPTPCDMPSSCIRPTTFSATLTYYFPYWFILQKVFSLEFMTTHRGHFGGILKIRRIEYSDFRIFRMASIGDLRGIKSLLDQRLVHPDTTWWGGWSPLHYAISHCHAKTCRYLLSRNADPLLEDGDNQQSAFEYAWMKILGKSFPTPQQAEFESVFANRECLEELGFQALHKIVLGLHGGLLSEQLISSPEEVDAVDNEGRTALSWAAQRGDIESVTLLLAHGAHHNIHDRAKTSPLHYAAKAVNPSCVKPLLQASADPNAVDHRLHTPLHAACKKADDLEFIKPLVLWGANMNAMTDYSWSPLIFATYRNHERTARYLLDQGAQIDLRGQNDQTPLAYAIEYNAHAVLRLLLQRGADYKAPPNTKAPTILHWAVRHADLATLRILMAHLGTGEFDMDGLEAADSDGTVLEELVNMRRKDGDPSATELGRELHAVVNKILGRQPGGLTTTTNNEENSEPEDPELEMWEDAVESLDASS